LETCTGAADGRKKRRKEPAGPTQFARLSYLGNRRDTFEDMLATGTDHVAQQSVPGVRFYQTAAICSVRIHLEVL